MKSLLISYFLCGAGLFSPLAGLHRFYLDKPLSGMLYLLTWGFFGIGTVLDLIRMPGLVDQKNLEFLFNKGMRFNFPSKQKLSSPERAILRCANDNNGVVTVPMVSLASGISMANAKFELDRLYKEGFCGKDVDIEGNEIFEFKGLKASKPL